MGVKIRGNELEFSKTKYIARKTYTDNECSMQVLTSTGVIVSAATAASGKPSSLLYKFPINRFGTISGETFSCTTPISPLTNNIQPSLFSYNIYCIFAVIEASDGTTSFSVFDNSQQVISCRFSADNEYFYIELVIDYSKPIGADSSSKMNAFCALCWELLYNGERVVLIQGLNSTRSFSAGELMTNVERVSSGGSSVGDSPASYSNVSCLYPQSGNPTSFYRDEELFSGEEISFETTSSTITLTKWYQTYSIFDEINVPNEGEGVVVSMNSLFASSPSCTLSSKEIVSYEL